MIYLTVNTGSSSLKLSVFKDESDIALNHLVVEEIGTSETSLTIDNLTQNINATNHSEVTELVVDWLSNNIKDTVVAISHRVVHGGNKYSETSKVDDELLEYLHSITPLAPNHLPISIECIKKFKSKFPEAEHLACFDTGIFHNVPKIAQTLALPKRLREKGVRRFGFHGLSYEYILDNFKNNEGELAAKGRVIIAHMGNGVSLAAFKNGEPIDMTMGYTPASGVIMSTRSGDIDPGVFELLINNNELSAELFYKEPGLIGVSETTGDMKTLLSIKDKDERAALAIDLFCYNIKKTIGSYAAALGGIDSLIFTASIGERSTEIRSRVTDGLNFMGIIIDENRNKSGERLISADNSNVGVHIINTNEEAILFKKAKLIIERGA